MTLLQPYIEQRDEAHTISNADFAALMATILFRGKQFRFRASGFSMSPTIRDGDVLTVSSPQHQPLQRGTIVAFLSPSSGTLTVHRIVAQRDGRYLLKGDNIKVPDCWITTANVIGVVNCVEQDGKIVHFSQGWEGVLLACLSKYNILGFSLRFQYALPRWLKR